jgi:hypothetical protein
MDLTSCSDWRVTGATVRGANHVRGARPNQDAIAWLAPDDAGAPLILAVADGHGAPLHFRSHLGSRFAVRTTIAVLSRFARSQPANNDPTMLDQSAVRKLAKELVHTWKARVANDLARRPISEWELKEISEQAPAKSVEHLEEDPAIAYGSTIIAGLFTQTHILYLQLGDGDILLLEEQGVPYRPPLPDDPLLLGNQTTSLCSPEAWRHVRTFVQPVHTGAPKCVMLSTDGYANSFVDAQGLSQALLDLCSVSHTHGLLELALSLPDWLRSTSAQGSGDDITVGLAFRNADSRPKPQ